ncbi:related to ERG25-C-4 methyl sterol oxidase [Sporisorium reilianum f. sp. reilianum]|uniref:Related to ERG25-C-4 methyl sterol oxidase n=1 Tax=Sporisorium reilianum f. sp. reilianum TaxID=72559 RepID=A0A2N8U9S2_9BASI|nr:related to ERG25-C-4 methyl sterol oxidase [Sporisorium reilianum f. sp. reilianum]
MATSTSTLTAAAPAADLADIDLIANPTLAKRPNKGRMTSTWHTRPASQWSYFEQQLVWLGVASPDNAETPRAKPPVYPKDAPVPVYPVWKMHALIAPRALGPLVAHHAFTQLTGMRVPVAVATAAYLAYFVWYGVGVFSWNNRMTDRFGTFDGAASRDGVPDVDTRSVALGLFMVVVSRALIAIPYLYNPSAPVLDLHTLVMLPVNCAAFAIAVDFWFYWYHRLMHEVPALWRYHRKHHTTKHPTAALGAFADHEQEFFDMVGIPVLAWLTWRINFATWWVSTCYILFIEASGHSGLRGYFQNPTVWWLRYLGCELCLEDHDIHHRHGWKKSGNYGKQTRLWDRVFGTMKDRIEGTWDNLNWDDPMDVPQPVPVRKAE